MNLHTKSFISLGSPHGVALTNLDKYIEQRKQEKRASVLTTDFQGDDQEDQISALQKEQSRLCEELNAERRRSESLKSTYSRALNLSSSQQKEKLQSIRRILQNVPKKSAAIQKALNYINQIENDESDQPKGSQASQLAQQAKEAELSGEKENRLARAIAKKMEQVKSEKEELEQQIDEAQKQLDHIIESRQNRKNKIREFFDEYKKRQATMKERIEALEAELEAQH